MLSKDVCKKCHKEFSLKWSRGWTDLMWIEDSIRWERDRQIDCFAYEHGICADGSDAPVLCSTDGSPPERCSYKLEHAVLESMNNGCHQA
jgi:hypothetical protein